MSDDSKKRSSKRVFVHMQWAYDQKLPSSRKSVLVSLAFRSDDNGMSFPSHSRLEKDTGICRDTLIAAIDQLEADGFIRVEREIGRVNRYFLLHPDIETSTKIPTGPHDQTSTKNPTGTKNQTSPKNRTHQSEKSDTHQSEKSDSKKPMKKPKKKPEREKALSQDFLSSVLTEKNCLPDDWVKAAMDRRSWSQDQALLVAEKFVNHYRGGRRKESPDGWLGAWQNWFLDEREATRQKEAPQEPIRQCHLAQSRRRSVSDSVVREIAAKTGQALGVVRTAESDFTRGTEWSVSKQPQESFDNEFRNYFAEWLATKPEREAKRNAELQTMRSAMRKSQEQEIELGF